MTAFLVVRATVPQADRAAFETWYQTEHLPQAKEAFRARGAQRGWCNEDPGLHIAMYEFADLAAARDVTNSEELKTLIKEFDRVWQNRVTRTRELLEIRQNI